MHCLKNSTRLSKKPSALSYYDQIWHFIVKEIEGQIVCQTDNENHAVRYCMAHKKPAYVVNCYGDERRYQNF